MRLKTVLAPIAIAAVVSGSALALPASAAGKHAPKSPRIAEKEHGKAGNKAPKKRQFELRGVVTAVDATARTLSVTVKRTKKGVVTSSDLVLSVDAGARIRYYGKPLALASVVVGSRVEVHGVAVPGEAAPTLIAKRINVRKALPAPSPTDSPTESPSPTDSPTESPSPTDSPTGAPEPTESPAAG